MVDGAESARGLSLEEHVLDVGRGGVDERVLLIEAARLDLARLLLLVDHLEVLVENVDASLGNEDAVGKLVVPLDATHIGHTQLVNNSLRVQVVHEEGVVGADEDFAEWGREDVVDLREAFLHDLPLSRVRPVETAHEDFASVAVQRADPILADEDAGGDVFSTLFEDATRLSQIFVEGQKHELTTLDVEVEQKVVSALVKPIVVDIRGLVQEDLLAGGLNRRHHLLVLRRQVVHVELFLFDKEEGGGDADGGMSLLLELEHVHALVVACREIVQRGVRRHNPVPVRVFACRVDREASLHVPEAHRAVL